MFAEPPEKLLLAVFFNIQCTRDSLTNMFNVTSLTLWVYLTPLLFIWGLYARSRIKKDRRNNTIRDEALKSGLTEPASLHPVINHNRCVGCGSCVNACPEQSGHEPL